MTTIVPSSTNAKVINTSNVIEHPGWELQYFTSHLKYQNVQYCSLSIWFVYFSVDQHFFISLIWTWTIDLSTPSTLHQPIDGSCHIITVFNITKVQPPNAKQYVLKSNWKSLIFNKHYNIWSISLSRCIELLFYNQFNCL